MSGGASSSRAQRPRIVVAPSPPAGVVGTITSALKTVGLFSGSNMSATNVEMLVEKGVWPSATPFNRTVAVDKSAILSGDYLAILRLDGLDPAIGLLTGGATGHSAVAVWNGSELYVVESTDANPLGPVYWPPPYGVIVHQYDTWISLAEAAGYHAVLLPIDPAISATFDEAAFWRWFSTVQGMAYGYHTMAYSLFDTALPMLNFPAPVDDAVVGVVLNTLDRLLPNTTNGVSGFSMFTWGLNKRLNISCPTLACVIDRVNRLSAAGQQPTTLTAAIALPDNDEWMFATNYSMVCSEFAARVWKVGLAGANPVWASIIGNEQTPKDNYQMALYAPNRFTSAQCPGGLTTPLLGNGTYCQLMGQYVLTLDGYNSVPLYAGMNNACPSQWPAYERCPPGNPTCC